MKEIQLSQGKVTLVDDEDYELVSQYKWHASRSSRSKWYAVRRRGVPNAPSKLYLHMFLLNPPDGFEVDHIDSNSLNNCRENLRVCTHAQNVMNSTSRGGTSQYKGVSWAKKSKKWVSQIRYKGKIHVLGHFTDEIEAARAYDVAALKYYEEFASPNFPLEGGGG